MKRYTRTIALLAATAAPATLSTTALAQDAGMMTDEKKEQHIDKKAKEILDAYNEKAFGPAIKDPDSIKNVVIEGTMAMPQMGISAPMKMTMIPSSGMLMSIEIPNLDTFTSGYYEGTAWGKSMMQGSNIMSGPEAAQIERESDLFASLDWKKNNNSITYNGTETIELRDGSEAETHVLELDTKDSDTNSIQYYSIESGLLLKTSTTVFLPGAGEAPSTTYTSDYRDVDGMMFPFSTVVVFGPQEQAITLENVTVNAELAEDAITPPQDILDMMDD